MDEKLMTVKEVSDKLRVSKPTVTSWLREGKLRGFRAGRLWRIYGSSVQAMIESGLQEDVKDAGKQ